MSGSGVEQGISLLRREAIVQRPWTQIEWYRSATE